MNNGGGQVEWGANEQIPDTASVNFGTAGHMHLTLLGRTETVAQITATAGLGVIQNRQAQTGINTSGTFIVNGSAASSFNGYIRDNSGGSGSGVLQFTKRGSGTTTLSGTNISYTGATTVNAGTLSFNSTTWANYSARWRVNGGGFLNINVTNGINLSGNVSGAGTIRNNGGAWTYFNGAAGQFSGFTGTLINTAGTGYFAFPAGNGAVSTKLQVDGVNFIIGPNGSGAGTWEAGELSGSGGTIWAAQAGSGVHTLQVGALNTSTTYAGVIRNNIGAGTATTALTKTGAGTLTLSGAHLFSGATTVNSGTLLVNGSTAAGQRRGRQ